MKTLLTSLLFVCTISCISQTKAQDIDHPQIDVYLNNYQTNRPVKTTSERSSYFAQAFYELLQTIPSFKNGLKKCGRTYKICNKADIDTKPFDQK